MTKMKLSWTIALIAMMGSLYFSEIEHFIPCSLCWYQRILMYPIVVILGVGLWKNERNALYYALPLSSIGIAVSLTHYLKQKLPAFDELVPCTSGIPCSAEYINWFGFVTIPFLALTAFAIITVLFVFELKKK